jgi:DNA-binding transcriptional MerR regulator
MSDEQNYTQVFYSPSDLIAMLDLKESTLRKYAYDLEKAGWKFGKNELGHRQYSERDIMAIRRLIAAKKNTSMTFEQAAKELVSVLKSESLAVPAKNNGPANNQQSDEIAELKELINKQTEVIKALSERLTERDQYIENYIQKRFEEQDKRLSERDTMLLERLEMIEERKREQAESIKYIAAAKEELEAELETQKKKGFIARLFGRT